MYSGCIYIYRERVLYYIIYSIYSISKPCVLLALSFVSGHCHGSSPCQCFPRCGDHANQGLDGSWCVDPCRRHGPRAFSISWSFASESPLWPKSKLKVKVSTMGSCRQTGCLWPMIHFWMPAGRVGGEMHLQALTGPSGWPQGSEAQSYFLPFNRAARSSPWTTVTIKPKATVPKVPKAMVPKVPKVMVAKAAKARFWSLLATTVTELCSRWRSCACQGTHCPVQSCAVAGCGHAPPSAELSNLFVSPWTASGHVLKNVFPLQWPTRTNYIQIYPNNQPLQA